MGVGIVGLALVLLVVVVLIVAVNSGSDFPRNTAAKPTVKTRNSASPRQQAFIEMISAVDRFGTENLKCQTEWERIRAKFGLSYDQSAELLTEGIENGWQFPKLDASDTEAANRRTAWLIERKRITESIDRLVEVTKQRQIKALAKIAKFRQAIELGATGTGKEWQNSSEDDQVDACLVIAGMHHSDNGDGSKLADQLEAAIYYHSFVDSFYLSCGDSLKSKRINEVIAAAEHIRRSNAGN